MGRTFPAIVVVGLCLLPLGILGWSVLPAAFKTPRSHVSDILVRTSVPIGRWRTAYRNGRIWAGEVDDLVDGETSLPFPRKFDDVSLTDAAAIATQESCLLLGTKSLGVDYGLVRTGIASTVGYDPTPIAILTGLNLTETCEAIVRFARVERAQQIVAGLPLHQNGTVAEQTNLTLAFTHQLAIHVLRELGPNVPVYLWDERYTSKEAAARVQSTNPDSELYGTLDADAACIILENYYHENGQGALRMALPDNLRDEALAYFRQAEDRDIERRSALQRDREEKQMRRREAIARDQALQQEVAASSSKKKKRKKKR